MTRDARLIPGPPRRRHDLAAIWRWMVQTARLCCGVPDYDVYLRHLRARHPDRPLPTYAEFFRERQTARYAGSGGRCC